MSYSIALRILDIKALNFLCITVNYLHLTTKLYLRCPAVFTSEGFTAAAPPMLPETASCKKRFPPLQFLWEENILKMNS